MSEIIIIGAGASGLIAARELGRAGKKVRILEARDRIGGRIYTLSEGGFSAPIELGAEFVHGKRSHTLKLLEEYKIPYHKVEGSFWNQRGGRFTQQKDVIEHDQKLNDLLKNIKEDISVETFIQLYLSNPEDQQLAESIRGFVKGFDAADPKKASILSFKEEWSQQDEQYRIEGGYIRLINALWDECKQRGVSLELNTPVKEIRWNPAPLEIVTEHKTFTTTKALVTVPLGLYQLEATEKPSLSFAPSLFEKTKAAESLGFGSVIKIVLEFKEAFWKKGATHHRLGAGLGDFSFLFAEETIPTWWSQNPSEHAILTGWLSGTAAASYLGDDDSILHEALMSISNIFKIEQEQLKHLLVAWSSYNWQRDPLARGAYAYPVVNGDLLVEQLRRPVGGQLYFAGEALNRGNTGTVDAALNSGLQVAEDIMLNIKHPVTAL
ncbi:MAG TPA: NAD(P)/FAD-dependent oxidoreductase [Cytophagales bacterium]|nr:NAD(P)/FAD-dependent oxidoreductase [Cytophagales bacterium]